VRAVLCLHDVSPAFDNEIRQALEWARERGLRPALGVVPDWHGSWGLSNHPAFCGMLGGHELLLHGYDHVARVEPEGRIERLKARLLTDGEGEFHSLPFGRAVGRMERGLAVVEKALGVRPDGFIAPAWLEHEDTGRAVYAAGMRFHEDHLRVRDLEKGDRFMPAVCFTARGLARAYASVGWAEAARRVVRRVRDVRVVLHPADFGSEMIVAAAGRLVEAIGEEKEWVGYTEYLGS